MGRNLVLTLLIFTGCSWGTGGSGGGGGGGGSGPDASGGSHGDAGNTDNSGTVRFVAMGDTGEGSDLQKQVADQIKAKCAADGCDFVLLLGDNLYDKGADSTDDPVWQTEFEQPYADIDLPFYAVLGNHDYGGKLLGVSYGGVGNEFDRGPTEVAYSSVSQKWRMPDTHYTLRFGPLGILGLDTDSIMWGNTDNGDQSQWIGGALAQLSSASWILAAGHHPYLSNGSHGNAGSYGVAVEGVELPIPVSQFDGEKVKSFFDNYVCGHADVYLCGHDHNRQWLDESSACGGTTLIVDGAGSHVTDLVDNGDAVKWEDDQNEGFLYVVVDSHSFTGTFIDKTGAENFTYTLTK